MKAFDLPIAKNPLKTRDDFVLSLEQLLAPLVNRYVNEGAGLHLGNSGAVYETRSALLEGWSRVLWGLAPYLAGLSANAEPAAVLDRIHGLELSGLRTGTDPKGEYFWGIPGDRDQREVEMAAVATSLLLAPQYFWEPLSGAEKDNLATWLSVINKVMLPPNNWEFFRILVNLALKSLGREYDPVMLKTGLDFIDQEYRGDGWYSDEGSFDYYNPFAFHYYGMLYAKLTAAEDPGRCERFRQRARDFARQFLPWYAADGACVPYGRSLTYRFATVSFFCACAFAGEEVLPWPVMKGIVLRNMRWWFSQPMFDHEGLMTVGYAYPNLVMAEQYNSPTSPYWSLKSFILLALPPDHPFWTAEEKPFPASAIPEQIHQPTAMLHVCRLKEDDQIQLFPAAQYPVSEHVNLASKYAKFAYSSKYGFSASHGSYSLEKTGCDSTLLFSEGDGYWRERRTWLERESTQNFLYSRWKAWNDVEVRSWVIPLMPWHVRIHVVESARDLECVEGGFSVNMQIGLGPQSEPAVYTEETTPVARAPNNIAIVAQKAGGFAALVRPDTTSIISSLPIEDIAGAAAALQSLRRSGHNQRQEPNLNILFNRSTVPILRGSFGAGKTLLCCAVYAASKFPENTARNQPAIVFDGRDGALVVSNLQTQVRLRIVP